MRLLGTAGRLFILVSAAQALGRQQARPVLGLGFQAQRGPPLVQTGGIAHWPQLRDTIPDLILGSVDLRLAPVHQHPVHQVRQVGGAGVTPRHRVLEQRQALLLQIRRRVLGQQPGRMRARLPDQPMAGPPMLADYLPQPRGVVPVNRRYDRLPFQHSLSRPQRHTGRLIPAGAQLHRLTQGWPQRPGWRSSADLLHAETGTRVNLGAMPPGGVARCRAAWARLTGRTTCVVHGDPNPGNVRMTADRVAMIDWDESHVDVPDLDLALPYNAAGLGNDAYDIAAQARAAWEAAVCWDPSGTDQFAVRRLAEVRAI
jgi:hypothetical protein